MSKYINSLMQISAASVAMMSSVFAADQTTMNSTPPQMCMVNNMCSSYPMMVNGYNVHMDIGYLLEQFVLTGTDFAIKSSNTLDTPPVAVDILRPKFDVASGLTAELGYYFEHDSWFLNAKFDWVGRKGHRNTTATGTEQIYTFSPVVTDLGYSDFTSVENDQHVHYYALQLDLNRGSWFTKNFAVEPHAGLKAAWIYYNEANTYTGGDAGVNIVNESRTTSFWGLGPDFGVNSEWNFCQDFSLFCDTTVALLCGSSDYHNSANVNGSATNYSSVSDKPIVMSPTARAILGFQYKTALFDNSQALRIRLAVDSAYYWNQYLSFVDANVGNDFAMIGMIVELGWDF